MPDSPQTAVRVGDDILHTDAHKWGVWGIIGGAVAGLAVGVFLVGGTILTGGALAVVLAGATIAGTTLLGGGIIGSLGKILGSHHSAGAKGKVLTGSPNVFIGSNKMPAARAEADVAHCEDHSDSESALEQPGVRGKKIAQGSERVLINGHYAARTGDRGTCDFRLGDGCPTVIIAGPPKTVAGMTITSETASIDGLITGMMIAGTVLLMIPAAAAMLSAGAAAGVSGALLYGQVALRLAGQFGLGYLLSKGGGAGMHSLGVNVFHLKEGSEALELMTFGGQVVTPFAGAKGFKAISDAPFMGGKAGSEVPGGEAPSSANPEDVPAGKDVPAGEDVPRRYGSTGAKPDILSTEAKQAQANAAYDQIRSNPDDVAQIAKNTGHSPETIQAVKDHLFNSQHDIMDPETGQVARGNFTADGETAEQWNKAAAGTAKPDEITAFNRLIAHEYVEQGLVSDGLLYQHPDGWIQQPNGEWEYWPNPNNFGAHDLSPNFRENPFSHYESRLGRSSEGIPRPNENYSNLDDVLAGVRRSLGEQGGPPEGGTSGPKGGGPAGGEKPFIPAEPLPPNPAEAGPITPAPEAEPVAVPEAAPEPAEALAPTEPQGPTPEPAPQASVQRGISPELYSKLRTQTPSRAIRDAVNENTPQPPYDDPVLPGQRVTGRLEADHIVPMKTITEMDGFNQLSEADQLRVLNSPDNFVGLSKTANTSKGSKSFEDWTEYKKAGTPVDPVFRQQMIQREQESAVELQNYINRLRGR